jgi:hypothetical protein
MFAGIGTPELVIVGLSIDVIFFVRLRDFRFPHGPLTAPETSVDFNENK